MLNDFGCAVTARTQHTFAGNFRFAPTSVLQSYIDSPQSPIVCECWHDLESAVKLVWIVAIEGYRLSPLFRIQSIDVNALLTYWKNAEECFLRPLLEVARAANYDSLLSHLSRLSPQE